VAHGAACLYATCAFLLLGFLMLYERHCVPGCVCKSHGMYPGDLIQGHGCMLTVECDP
jgi:hypothetical protein